MYMTPDTVGLNVTQDVLDETLNNLVVTMEDFSSYACTDGRMYGVSTLADGCDYVLNGCARSAVVRGLIDVNRRVETYLNYAVGVRYHTETLPYNDIITLSNPYLAAIGQSLGYEVFTEGTDIAVSPFLQTSHVTQSGNGYRIASFPFSYGNPMAIIFRDPNNMRLIEPVREQGFPRRMNGMWEVALPMSATNVIIQHTAKAFVDVMGVLPSEKVVPFYRNSNQKIPFVRQELISGGVRFWFNIWVLLDNMFFEEGANFTQLEYYKLVESIDFKKEVIIDNVPVKFTFYTDTCSGEQEERVADCVSVISYQDSILRLDYDTVEWCRKTRPDYVTISYKTDSRLYAGDTNVPAIVRAVSHLVAADLPLSVCGCEIKDGFVKAAQKPYTDIRINPVTGDMVQNMKHGNFYGHLVYNEVISTLKPYPKVKRI